MDEDRIIYIDNEDNNANNLIFESNDKFKTNTEIITKAPDWDITPPFEINRGENEL